MRRLELPQRLRQPVVAGVTLGREPQEPAGSAARAATSRAAAPISSEARRAASIQRSPAGVGVIRLCPRWKSETAERPLGVGELVGERGLREVEAPGRGSQRALLGHRQQELEVPQLEAPRGPVHTMNISHGTHENNSLFKCLRPPLALLRHGGGDMAVRVGDHRPGRGPLSRRQVRLERPGPVRRGPGAARRRPGLGGGRARPSGRPSPRAGKASAFLVSTHYFSDHLAAWNLFPQAD